MESFFDREVKRLEFVGERARMRDQEKKLMDDEKIAKQEVNHIVVIVLPNVKTQLHSMYM